MKEELNRKRVWDERVCCSTSARYFIVKVFKPFTQSWPLYFCLMLTSRVPRKKSDFVHDKSWRLKF
jgi:hypothetical protein